MRNVSDDREATSPWRFMPAGIGAWFVVVAAVNGAMIYCALHSFPGEAGGNAFDVSNHYDSVMHTAEQERQLGWAAATRMQGTRPVLLVTVADGAPLAGAVVRAAALRPVGPENRTTLDFAADKAGRYVATAALPGLGRWDLHITVSQGGKNLHVTRRVLAQ